MHTSNGPPSSCCCWHGANPGTVRPQMLQRSWKCWEQLASSGRVEGLACQEDVKPWLSREGAGGHWVGGWDWQIRWGPGLVNDKRAQWGYRSCHRIPTALDLIILELKRPYRPSSGPQTWLLTVSMESFKIWWWTSSDTWDSVRANTMPSLPVSRSIRRQPPPTPRRSWRHWVSLPGGGGGVSLSPQSQRNFIWNLLVIIPIRENVKNRKPSLKVWAQ